MQANRKVTRGNGRRATHTLFAVIAIGLLISATAQAAPVIVASNEDAASPGMFTLNFGEMGGITSGEISTTDYEIEVDPQAGTSRIVGYYQEVQPLTLPGGYTTGDIVVELVEGSSTGTFDARTRTFTTSEYYAIHFSGDLSAFGLESPVVLPSTSAGIVDLGGRKFGRVDLEWEGKGELANPFDPANPLMFSYTCTVNTVFAARADLLVRLGLEADVRALNLPSDQESGLIRRLENAALNIDRGYESRAVRVLQGFVNDVTSQTGWSIQEEDAQMLIHRANDAIIVLKMFAPWISR